MSRLRLYPQISRYPQRAPRQITIAQGSDNQQQRLKRAEAKITLVAIRFNPDLKDKYAQLVAAGQQAIVAIIAIIRKLVVMTYTLLRDNRLWAEAKA
jgi:hypothetical protein